MPHMKTWTLNSRSLGVGALLVVLTSGPFAFGQTPASQAPLPGPPPGPLMTQGVRATTDVVYGHKDGMALTFDLFKPASPNGAAVIHVVSGGWVSRYAPPNLLPIRERQNYDELLSRGFTVISLRHGASPRYNIPEIVPDIHRAVRFIRTNAMQYGIDAGRIGIYGNSSGGHLSLLLGLNADPGNPSAEDSVLRVSNRVAAIVSYYAPSDLDPAARAVTPHEGRTSRYPALNFDYDKYVKEMSPITHISADDPPVLILHGEKDMTVPVKEGEALHRAFQQKGVTTDFILFPGAGHSFQGDDAARATKAMADWFTKHLQPGTSSASPQLN
jgi:acetyl esterase/lipase